MRHKHSWRRIESQGDRLRVTGPTTTLRHDMIQRVGHLFIYLLTFVADTGNFKPDQNLKD